MDFDELKEVWKKTDHLTTNDSDKELHRKLKALTGTQRKMKQYFRNEMIFTVIAFMLILPFTYFYTDLQPYFYKIFAIVFLSVTPLSIRLYLSMKRLAVIDYSNQLRQNLVAAHKHLKTTIRFYYSAVVFVILSLVVVSWFDEFFLQLPAVWKVGIMSYFFIFLIAYFYFINKLYGSRLKELEGFLEDL